MKRFARIALAWAACMLLLGCQSHRVEDISQLASPSQRLPGHWRDANGDNMYYGQRDSMSGIGSFIMSHPGGRVVQNHYQVTSEDPSTQMVNVNLLFADGSSRTETNVIATDGVKLTNGTLVDDHYTSQTLARVDDAVAPEAYAAADGSTHMYDVASSAPVARQTLQTSSQWNPPGFVQRRAAIHLFAYIMGLYVTAAGILFVVSLMFFSTLGLPTILAHWAVALVGGWVCLFLLHVPIGAGLFDILVGFVLLGRALFPKTEF